MTDINISGIKKMEDGDRIKDGRRGRGQGGREATRHACLHASLPPA